MNLQQQKTKMQELGHKAVQLCEQLERGQANTPMSEHLRSVVAELDSAPFAVVLLGLTPDALKTALAWMFGEDFALIAVNNTSLPGLMEITIADKGYALHNPNQSYQLFEQIEPFMEALEATLRQDQAKGMAPLRMAVSTRRGARGLKIFVPENVQLLLDQPSLLNALIAESNLLMVAAPLRYTLSREDHQAVDELVRNMEAFWPLLTVDELHSDTGLPEIGWWEQHGGSELLPPKLLTTHVQAKVSDLISNLEDYTRQRLFLQFHAGRLHHAINALAAHQQQAVSRLEQKRQQASADVMQSPADKNDARQVWDQLRQLLEESSQSVRKNQEQAINRFSLASAPVWKDLQGRLESMSMQEIEQKQSHSKLLLNLREQVVEDFSRSVLKHSKALVKEQWLLWQEQARNMVLQANQQLQVLNSGELREAELPDRSDLYATLAERCNMTVNYRGEMPRRTFMGRLSDGRRVIMGMSMLVMVIGGMATAVWGIDLRATLASLAPLLFIGALIYTYLVWPKEDAERMEKELERIRDGIRGELKRLLGETQRVVQTLVNDMSESQRRRWQTQLKELQNQFEDQQFQQDKQRREQAKQQEQALEQQLKIAQQLERELRSIQDASTSLAQAKK